MNDLYKEEIYNELRMLGGEENVEFYKQGEISFGVLKDALLCGYTINELQDTYNKYIKSSLIDCVTFNELILTANMVKKYGGR